MKRRIGFVSNSSSCSFVVMGYKIPKDKHTVQNLIIHLFPDEWEKWIDDYDDYDNMSNAEQERYLFDFLMELDDSKYNFIFDDEDGYKSNTHMIVGEEIAGGDGDFSQEVYNTIDFDHNYSDLIRVLEEINIPKENVILTSTRLC